MAETSTSSTVPIHYSDLWDGIARAVPERLAAATADDEMTWGRFRDEAASLAAHLRSRGLSTGDAAATLLYNRTEFLVFLWACLAIGVAPVAINYRYRAGEVRDLLVDSSSRVLLIPTSMSALAVEAAAGLDVELITVDDGGDAVDGATDYRALLADDGPALPPAPRGAEMRLYTGGTTGRPRAVVWDLDTLLIARRHSTWGLIGAEPPADVAAAVRIAADAERPRVVTLPMSPLLHGTAQSATMAALALGGTIVMHAAARMDVGTAYELIGRYGVTRLIVAGDVLALPLAEAAEKANGLPTVTSVISSGMRFSDEAKARLHRLGDMTIVDMFASSEGGPYALGTSRSADDLPAPLTLTPDAALLDEKGRELPLSAGTLGLVAFRGILPRGYYGDPVKTAETFREMNGHRYVVPGDWARARGDGTIDLLGRLSAVVNTGGEKVYPAEVEEALIEHPSVDDAIVFGLPDPRFGEVVCATIAATGPVDVDEVISSVGERVAGYKKPRHLFVRQSLDRTQTGKVPLARIRADAAEELAARAEGAHA
ncbi:AMP-binding protein [Microbacterium halotolerans]|uniref:AMP-binding protein n=1 Tax=Microbacterium halotolerans TaxID=246613 RepID=UPI0013C363ED|nr:AMP-binding protein [Microbacterium halotolerans]